MSLKQEIETWVAALGHYDNNEFDEALRQFEPISDTSKILFNCGVIHATLGEHEKAVDCYQRAVRLDQYLAVAYFQQGVSNFLLGDFEEALANFNDTLLYLRGNSWIDYEQLGLKFKLHSCEVLFNRGLCYVYLQQKDAGLQDLSYAAKEKAKPDHDVIDEALRDQAEGYTVFSIPMGIIYRPNEAKVKNLKTKDYLGKARLVAATDPNNAFTGFAGTERKLMNAASFSTAKDDRPEEKLSYAATNLVKPGLSSRTRQQSEPPLTRNVFPPTPPPEGDLPGKRGSGGSGESGSSARSQSARPMAPKPPALELGRAAFEQPAERPRLGTVRSASERPRPTREHSSGSTRSHNTARERNARETPLRRVISDDESHAHDPIVREDPIRPTYGRSRTADTHRSRQRPGSIEEEDEDAYAYPPSSIDSADFEILPHRSHLRRPSGPAHAQHYQTPPRAPTASSSSSARRAPHYLKTIRVKVYAEDTRYVFIDPEKRFKDFVAQIREKFGIRNNFKIRYRDEEDMITMADQDDLGMAVENCREVARKERTDMGKMEVWIQEV